MVVIQIKNGEKDSFLYETTGDKTGDFVVRELCQIFNMRVRLSQLKGGLGELSRHGPMKPQDKVGLDEIKEQNGEVIEKGQYYDPDPTGSRTGNGVGPQLSATMEKVCEDADAVLSPANVQRKVATTLEKLQEKLDNMRGAVMMGKFMTTCALNGCLKTLHK